MSKKAGLLLFVALAVSSLVIVEFAHAQSLPKPAVPEFSIQVVDRSYDVPTTYYTDPYSGKQVAYPGYHVDDIRVEGLIKNQHFTPYTIPNPNSTSSYDTESKIDFYYNIRYKGHFGSEWRQLYGSEDVDFLKQKYGSEYTNFTANRYNAYGFREGDQVDFQVKAIIGFETWGFVAGWPYRILNGEDSGWSSTLTITISKNSTSSNTYATTIDSSPYPALVSPQPLPSPTSTPTPDQTPDSTQSQTSDGAPDQTTDSNSQTTPQSWHSVAVIGAIVAILAVVAFILVYFDKRWMKK